MSAVLSEEFSSLQPDSRQRKSGRAAVDERGESVWEWQVETGVFKRDVTDEQLRRLEAPELAIAEFSPESTGTALDFGSSAVVLERISRRTPPATVPQRGGTLGSLWARLRRA